MPRTDEIDPVIPDHLADALRRAAAAVPPTDLDITGPTQRVRSRRRRNRAVAAIGTVAAALTAVVAVNLAGTSDDATTPPVIADNGGRTEQPPAGLFLPTGWAELLPDGTERPLPKAQPDDVGEDRVRLADGRLVTLALRPPEDVETDDLEPGVLAPWMVDAPSILAVFDTAGNLVGERELRRPSDYNELIGVVDGKPVVRFTTEADANLHSQSAIVAIDPDTFEETTLATDVGTTPMGSAANGRAAITSQRSQAVDGGPNDKVDCWTDVIGLPDGASRRVDIAGCYQVWDTELSPDGRYLALVVDLAHASIEGDGQTSLQVIDLESGGVVDTKPIPDPCNAAPEGTCVLLPFHAITWEDADTATDVTINTVTLGPRNGPFTEPPDDRQIVTIDVP